MQRYVLICRHAETYDPYPLQPDFERELTPEGIRQANETGKWLREHYLKADAILASPARRASDTARILAKRLYFDPENINYLPDLYNPIESQLFHSLSNLPDKVKNVLLISHNPGLTQFTRSLLDTSLPYLQPAQALAVSMELEKWSDIYITTGKTAGSNVSAIL